jgi:3-(3-hydroxy-phenyl)propionate hydroxylase
VRPQTQLHWNPDGSSGTPDVTVVGDRTGALKAFFDAHSESVLFLRPDRCIAGACIAQRAPELSASIFEALTLTPEGGDPRGAAIPVLYVAQSTSEPSRTLS